MVAVLAPSPVAGSSELRSRLLPGGLTSVLQPIWDLDTQAVVGYEALVRGSGPLTSPASLTFLELLTPDVVKLDMSLLRSRRDRHMADPLCLEWDVVVLSPHFSGALIARDLLTGSEDAERLFEFAVTYDRAAVSVAARALLATPRRPDRGRRPVLVPPQHRSLLRVRSDLPQRRRSRHQVFTGRPPRPPSRSRPREPTTTDVTLQASAPRRDLDPLPEATVLGLLPDAVGAAGDGTLADLAEPAVVIPARSRTAEVDEIFRRDEALTCVVAETDGGPVLVDRAWFESALTGRLGYGRLLHARTRVVDMVSGATLVLPHDFPVLGAAAALIERRAPGAVSSSLVVRFPEGGLAVAHATAVFERLARHFAHQSVHDPLTGLPNRTYLRQHLLDRRGGHRPAVLFYVDLDRFKDVNDAHGHAAGDQVLVQFAERLRGACRAGDVVVRLGGDEFAVLSRDPMTPVQSRALAQRIVLEAAAPFPVVTTSGSWTMEVEVTIGASVGVAHSESQGALPEGHRVTSLEVLLRQADLAMYRAKEHGRGRSAVYDGELSSVAADSGAATRERHRMERRLRAALDTGAVVLHYQPVVELPCGRVTGVEALARWHDDELGSVPPDRFVRLAEQTGMVVDLGRHVLLTACRQAAAWDADGRSPTVSVNVSPLQIAHGDFPQVVRDALGATGLDPRRLCLELTETAAVSDLEQTVAALTELRGEGVRVALDDFGTGHSSLTLLRTLPLDLVKIDRSFVAGVARSAQDAMLIRMVIETAHTLGLRVCAEGIEHHEQAVQLAALGCDAAQGWYFGMPEPPSERLARVLGTAPVGVDPAVVPPVPLTGADELVLVTTPDRTITYASSTSLQLLGLTPQEMLGTNVVDHLPRGVADRVAAGEQITGLTSQGRARHRANRHDGSTRWFDTTSHAVRDDAGAVVEVMSISRDVTDAVEATTLLELSENRFRHAFDLAPTGMAITDMEGRMLRVNEAFGRLLGHPAVELVGKTVAAITHPDDLAADLANSARLQAGTDHQQQVAKRYLSRAGEPVPVVVSVSVVHGDDGQPGHAIAHVVPDAPSRTG